MKDCLNDKMTGSKAQPDPKNMRQRVVALVTQKKLANRYSATGAELSSKRQPCATHETSPGGLHSTKTRPAEENKAGLPALSNEAGVESLGSLGRGRGDAVR